VSDFPFFGGPFLHLSDGRNYLHGRQ